MNIIRTRRGCNMVVYDKQGILHHLHSSRLIVDERKMVRDIVCTVCNASMQQDNRSESARWVFVKYVCVCGNDIEYMIEKEG